MVKDFTPARGNTWTGVSIKSPVLERPKVAQFNPILINETEPEGEVTGAAILPVYDPYYFYLAGNKEPYYIGNISGSFIDTYAMKQKDLAISGLINAKEMIGSAITKKGLILGIYHSYTFVTYQGSYHLL